jgi:plastocyanin
MLDSCAVPRFPSLFLACALGTASAHAGTITGKVELVDKNGRSATDLSDVVVYVEGPKAKAKPARVSVVMKGKEFRPRVVAIAQGGTIDFPNEDPVFHNAFSVSGANRFDLDLYKKPQSKSWTFQNPGIARVYCNIHPQMSAVVVVRDNPYFATAGVDGSFTIEGVPAGRWQLTAWQERAPQAAVELTVPADGRVTASLRLDASQWKRVQHKNKFGKDYKDSERY